MDQRYEHHQMAALLGEPATYNRWLAVEQAVARAQHRADLIPALAAEQIVALGALNPLAVQEAEAKTRHDVAAFLDVASRLLPAEGKRWLHYGLTSSDVVDTANALALRSAGDILCAGARGVVAVLEIRLVQQAEAAQAVRWARTHGQHAEPIPLALQWQRLSERMRRAHDRMADTDVPMKLGGPTGQYLVNSEAIEEDVARFFELPVDRSAGQIVSRDFYADWAYAAVGLAGAVERVATEVRLSAQTGIDELAESFGSGQVGSTGMPHKRNPIRSERLCGLARVARGYLGPILETADSMWGERDISNSSVERLALRELAILVAWMLDETIDLLSELVATVPEYQQFPVPSSVLLAKAVREGEQRAQAHARIASQSSKVVS